MSEEGAGKNRRQRVRFYFDFVSPYSWIALMRAGRFAERHDVDWDLRPVVYAKLLDATGLTGPGEVALRRRYMFADVVRCARRAGLELEGPPAHPFRSLEALRTACIFRTGERALDLCAGLANAAWGEGKDLTDLRVLEECVTGAGRDATRLRARIDDPAIKSALRSLTAEALESGVFGVPTFIFQGEMFWGQDRMSHLADRIRGRVTAPGPRAAELLGRPRGADRAHSPRKEG